MRFLDRNDAGRRLAAHLEYLRAEDPVVVGLPRGGVVVAAEVARALSAPLDVLVVRKLGVPWQPELAMGAIAEGGFRVMNEPIVSSAGLGEAEIETIVTREVVELERRLNAFRQGRPTVVLGGRTVILIDDGIATGATASVAGKALRAAGARKVVLAIPVSSPESLRQLHDEFDEIVCLQAPRLLMAIGQWYEDFEQVDDETVAALLEAALRRRGRPSEPRVVEVEIEADDLNLPGDLSLPAVSSGIVIFAHGSGSSRHSPRNRSVARRLNHESLATLLFDLLSPSEERDRANVFDISLLARRLGAVAAWTRTDTRTRGLDIGYFGASTGAAAALWAAAEAPTGIGAVVSRGGRPDLAGIRLKDVRAPTLLIVGGNDPAVLELNRDAATKLRCVKQLEVVEGASHLFEEPGTLDRVAELATAWFRGHLRSAATSRQYL